MSDRPKINTEGGDYREIDNRGQYAEGDIQNKQIDSQVEQGLIANDRSQVQVQNLVQNFVPTTPAAQRDRSEAKLLEAVRNEVAGRLAQSLHQRVYVELHKEEDPRQVVQPWAVDVKLGSAAAVRCPEGTRMVEIFDRAEIGGRLLVLGAPGSGKTTMLLQLAEELVRRAGENAARPVPVLLNLSAWKAEFKDISSWMVVDLKLKYGVRKDIAQKWLEEGRILPLLDGLDELMSERQKTCVRALNAFLPGWSGVPLVVCSRLEEYQAYGENLGLNGAVILQPMTDEQIERFLRGAKCDWLWEAVREDADVMDGEMGLARSPLLLTILVLASDGLQVDLWQHQESAQERQRILFEAYIAQRLKRRYVGGKNLPATKHGQKPYKDDEKTKVWLGWLALRLIEENQTEFFIEKLQPKILKNAAVRLHISILISLVSLGIGGIIGISSSLATRSILGMLAGLIYGLAIGMVYTILRFSWWRFSEDISFVEKIEFSWDIFKREFPVRVFRNCIDGLAYGLFIGLLIFFLPNIKVELIRSLFLSMSVGCFAYGFFAGIVQSISSSAIETKYRDNQSVFTSVTNSFVVMAFFLPSGFCTAALLLDGIYGQFPNWLSILFLGTGFGCVFGLANGGMGPVSDHVALRLTLWLFGYSPWNYSKFLRYCTDRGFLQRVGGGYRFVHALLRDHFAEHYTPK